MTMTMLTSLVPSDFLLFMPSSHDDPAPALEAALSYYSHIVTINAEGDSNLSEDTLEGLGTTGFLFQALFGSLLKVANPDATAIAPTRPTPTRDDQAPPTADALHSLPASDRELAESLDMASSVASVRYAYGASPARAQQIMSAGSTDNPPRPLRNREEDVADFQQEEDEEAVKIKLTDLLPEPGYFLAGAVSGGVSRTATAPLDRLKVYLLVNTQTPKDVALAAAKHGKPLVALRNASGPIVEAMATLWKAGGFRTFFAGTKPSTAMGVGGRRC